MTQTVPKLLILLGQSSLTLALKVHSMLRAFSKLKVGGPVMQMPFRSSEQWDEVEPTTQERKATRYEVDFRVWLTLPHKGGMRVSGRAIDVTELGMGVYVAAPIEAGHTVELEFVPPGSTQVLSLKAIVRNRRSFHYGLEFWALSAFQKRILGQMRVALELQ